MPPFTEGFVHRAVRRYLQDNDWKLVAGQWPGGTDDELHILYIVDPTVARDRSPDPRRHSLDKFVPDVVALRENTLLIIEAKPEYSTADYEKLGRLPGERRTDLYKALVTFGSERDIEPLLRPELLTIRPTLAFGTGKPHPVVTPPWLFLLVDEKGEVRSEGLAS